MSLGSWDPAAESAAYHLQIEPATLDRLIGYSREDQLAHLDQLIEGDEAQILAGLMLIEHGAWLEAAESRPDDDLVHLIRFFAVAENLPGWEAGSKSPVIPLAKALRSRGAKLDREFLQWLREVSDNRFLPYGPL
jgi:DNA-binding FadR family transcriptional regulator